VRVLLDTCVISEIARPQGNERVRDRVSAIRSQDLFLSVITIGEIAKGIALLDAGRKKRAYGQFLLGLQQDYGARLLPVDHETARLWGELTAGCSKRGITVSTGDGLIAATAIQHGLSVMTRNVDDFQKTGAMFVNPWQDP